jgi:ribokinase
MGETLIARGFDLGPGGKGSNQAVQAARLGADVEFVGMIGRDAFAEIAIELYREEGVGTAYLTRSDKLSTAIAFIGLDGHGDNVIVLEPGANAALEPRHVEEAYPRIQESDCVITQLEIPVESAFRALRLARRAGALAVLNPAPVRPLDPELLGLADVVTPNETELRILLGLGPDDPTDSLVLCRRLLALGVRAVVLTRGARGALVLDENGLMLDIPAFPVAALDTTGAGDAFSATLAVSLAVGMPMAGAARRACAAGALACTKLGVVPALANLAQIADLIA